MKTTLHISVLVFFMSLISLALPAQLGLACNATIQVSLDSNNSFTLTPEMALEGGPYDYTDMQVTPSTLDLSDVGTTSYTVVSTSTGSTCWGQLEVCTNSNPNCIDNSTIRLSFPILSTLPGDNICVPMKVENFTAVNSLEGTLSWDPAVLTYTGMQNFTAWTGFNPNGATNESRIDEGLLPFVWFDNTGNTPITIADQSTLAEFCFDVIGAFGTESIVEVTDEITGINASQSVGTSQPSVDADVDVSQGTVYVGPLPDFSTGLKVIFKTDEPANIGSLYKVDFTVSDFDDLYGVQTFVLWDSTVINIDTVTISSVLNSILVSTPAMDNANPNKGKLRMSWSDAVPVSLPDNTVLFTMYFNVVGEECDNTIIKIGDIGTFPSEVIEVLNEDFTNIGASSNSLLAQISGTDCGTGCTLADVIMPESSLDIDALGVSVNSISQIITIDNLVNSFGYTASSITPTWDVSCTNLAMTFNDQIFNSTDGFKVIRMFTILDWLTANTLTFDQVINIANVNIVNSSLACNSLVNVSVAPWTCSATLNPDMVIQGTTGNLTITPTTVGLGSHTYTVTDLTTGDTCWGTVNVEDKTPPVIIVTQGLLAQVSATANDPNPTVKVFAENIDNGSYDGCGEVSFSPPFFIFDCSHEGENTVNLTAIDEYGNTNSAMLTVTIEFTGGNNFPCNSGNGNGNNDICDFLPHTAHVGDCDSGHSLDDDVEWPADINVADHRIDPAGLVAFGGINANDAEPQFFNNTYSATYEDVVISLGTEILLLERRWSVLQDGGNGYTWSYNQEITIDLTEIVGLVSTTTIFNRPIPGVQLTDAVMTDATGTGVVDENDIVTPYRADSPKNGLNIRDLVIVRNHVLGIEYMNDLQIIAADLSVNDLVSTLDLVLIERIILGTEVDMSNEWLFINNPNVMPIAGTKGNYIGIKPGDVDDSALLNLSVDSLSNGEISYADVTLNEDENYEIPMMFNGQMSSLGAELVFDLNEDNIEVLNVSSTIYPGKINYAVQDGKLTVLLYAAEDGELSQLNNSELLTISVRSKVNTTLDESMRISDTASSYLLDEQYELFTIGGDVTNKISTSTHDTAEGLISIYPNPVSDYIQIETENKYDNLQFELFDYQGKLILSQTNVTSIDVSSIESGIYMYVVAANDEKFSDKVVILK